MNRAVFLDRDGVLNPPMLNPATGAWESPHHPADFSLYPWTIDALRQIQAAGYLLFVISNQPSAAKGKVTLAMLAAVHERFHAMVSAAGIHFSAYYYCHHHPHGSDPGLTMECDCRKPKPFFIEQARAQFALALPQSWLLGDRDSDVLCGQAAGVRTIQIAEPHSAANRGGSTPDYTVATLADAVPLLI